MSLTIFIELFDFLLKVSESISVKEICYWDFKTVAYLLDRYNTRIFALIVYDRFDRCIGNAGNGRKAAEIKSPLVAQFFYTLFCGFNNRHPYHSQQNYDTNFAGMI